jgi:haloalkane dehalogenase
MNYPTWLDREEYPFEGHDFDLEMGRMHYVDEGQGEPIVMVHGNPTWSFLYRHVIKEFSSGYRCIAMDHLGFGLSDKPTEWSYLPEEHSHNLAALLDSLGLNDITLVVQDWGGPIGLSYALDHPDKIKRLIILNTWMWPVNKDWYYFAFSKFTGGFLGRFLIKRFNFFARVIMPLAYGNSKKLTNEVHQHYLQPLQNAEERKGCWVLPREITGSTEWLDHLWSRREALADKPKLIVWGMKDIAFREKELNEWLDAYPDSNVVRLENVGHYVQEEGKVELSQAMRLFYNKTG